MRFVIRLCVWCISLLFLHVAFSQPNRVKYNNQQLFLSGANLAWINFSHDIGPGNTDFNKFGDILLQMHDHGGNALRWWLHTDGRSTPAFNNSGFVTGPGTGTIADMKTVLDIAWQREIGVNLCLWSFDMLRSANDTAALRRNRLMLTDTNYTRAYINNCLIPMVDSLKGHPAILSWEIFNEPEGMSQEFGFNGIVNDSDRVPMSAIQRFINMCAGAIHRADTSALVTNGSWSFIASTDVITSSLPKVGSAFSQMSSLEKQQIAARFNERYRSSVSADEIMLYLQRIASLTNYNYYSNSRLIGAGGDSNGTLDFYSVHYYSGILPSNPTSISPFSHPASYWVLTKPIVVAEFHMTTGSVPKEYLYPTLYSTGYAGALPWSWTDNAVTQPVDMLAGMQFMWDHYRADVDVNGIGGFWPNVTITSPADSIKYPDSTQVTITAAASDSDGTVVSVEFFVSDTSKIGEADTSPYTLIWKNIPAGDYRLTAIATDNQGHKRTSNTIHIAVGKILTTKLEAEAATFVGSGFTVKSDINASNGFFLDMATQSGTVTWKLPNVPADGSYGITFGFKLFYDHPKTQYVNVNGVRTDTVVFDATSNTLWSEKSINVNLIKGANTVQMELSWGWMYVDYLSVPSSFVAVSVKNSSELPNVYSLEQNYPNPFNPATTIRYSLAQPGQVKLRIYDLLGRLVATLVDEKQNAGVYNVPFDARTMASGLYFYRIEAGKFTQVKKMLVLK
jgi:Bacterial Ig domain/Carbohydrate binding module (family 35)/Secretion system C-terminal sorting domain